MKMIKNNRFVDLIAAKAPGAWSGLVLLFMPHLLFAQAADSAVALNLDSSQARVTSGPVGGSGYYKVLLVSALLLLILALLLFMMKKRPGLTAMSGKANMRILARMTLGPKQTVMVVSIEDTKYILGVTDQSVTRIDKLGPVSPEELSSYPGNELSPFAQVLQKVVKRRAD